MDVKKTNSGWSREQGRRMGEAVERSVKETAASSAPAGLADEGKAHVNERGVAREPEVPEESSSERSSSRSGDAGHEGEASPRWGEAIRDKNKKAPSNNT